MARRASQPRPITVVRECSLCGLDWDLHDVDDAGEVTALECIRLLKDRQCRHVLPIVINTPPVAPWVRPFVDPMPRIWCQTTTTPAGNVNSSTVRSLEAGACSSG